MGKQTSLKDEHVGCTTPAWLLSAPRGLQGHGPGFLQNGGKGPSYRGQNQPRLLDLLADLGHELSPSFLLSEN